MNSIDTGPHFEKKYIAAAGVLTGAVEYEHYLYAGGLMFGKYITVTQTDGVTMASTSTEYYSKDNLGSIVALTDGTGTVTQRLSYDPWGKRRYPDGTADPNGLLNNPDMYHGYTGHEMLDDVGLIHMNGRLYDPVTARFLSADPHIQDPLNLQSYNRYSYCWGNPMVCNDPSGYFSLGGFLRTAAIVAVAVYTGGATASWAMGTSALTSVTVTATSCTLGLNVAGAALVGATAGLTGGLLMSGGDINYAFKSAIAGGLTSGLGGFGGTMFGTAGAIAGQGLGSGISAQMFGGDFTIGLRYGLLGAIRSEAFNYMKTETDRLASKWWGADKMNRDEFGNLWTYGNRGCASGGGKQCETAFPERLLMPSELKSAEAGLLTPKPLIGNGLSTTPVLGVALNAVSKTHDWLNNALTAVYDPTTGGARDRGILVNTVIDAVSTAGMLPAAQFTAKALWQPPLQGK